MVTRFDCTKLIIIQMATVILLNAEVSFTATAFAVVRCKLVHRLPRCHVSFTWDLLPALVSLKLPRCVGRRSPDSPNPFLHGWEKVGFFWQGVHHIFYSSH
jgi:hypothetical protein